MPFASGGPITLTAQPDGSAGLPSSIAFGAATSYPSNLAGVIDTTQTANLAFILPRGISITGLSAMFSVTSASAVPAGGVRVIAELYHARNGNRFTPVMGTKLPLAPNYSGTVQAGQVVSGNLCGLNIKMDPCERLMLVFYLSGTGAGSGAASLIGTASAGLLYK
jgi:BclB C-terminal domain-containing protein